ncbi:MAG TPA: hypothetical protein VEK11_24720 [Thermoanaerobaculia bacterium]|nr:hypothetical protein [Thermoanaerobaculia bacterium]
MRVAEFFDRLTDGSSELPETLRQLSSMSGDEWNELRAEAVRRLTSAELAPAMAVAVLAMTGAEAAVPDLVRLLRSAAPVTARAAALLVLRRYTTYDVESESATLDHASLPGLVEAAFAVRETVEIALQTGTPFERLALAGRDEDEFNLDEIIDELLDAFYTSPEAAADDDGGELRFWAGEFVRLGVLYGYGSPVLWGPGDIDAIASELLPRKVTIGSAAEAEGAVPAFRTFFRWASRVAPVADAEAIDAELANLADEFPAMLMDERRFGLAKSFVAQGTAAGFDMSTEEGLLAFQEHYNRQRMAGSTAARKKLEATKKRKAKMAKASRKKNRRRK